MSRRSALSDLISQQLAAANAAQAGEADKGAQAPAPTPAPARVGAGPVRTMGLSLDRLKGEEQALREALAAGATVVELDPALIAPSFVADRFVDEEDDGGALRRSIAESGQESPILARPHPDEPGRFQVAFGHRRVRACRALGIKVRAVVRALSDAELVVAQGAENAARVDLSFIEKASFAHALERRGFDRPTIMQALATDKTELSKMIAAARAVPAEFARQIGPAPAAGRRRWLAFAEALADAAALKRARAAVAATRAAGGDSDARFAAAFAAVLDKPAALPPARREWRDAEGRAMLRLERRRAGLMLSVDPQTASGFEDFLVSRLDDLLAEFRRK